VARLVAGLAVLVLSAIPVEADRVSSLEVDVFRPVNDLPGAIYPVVYPFMQLGNVLVVPIVAIAALIARRTRLAVALFVGGAAAWVLPKIVKRLVERGRPDELLSDVHIHGAAPAGLGFVSGHIAIAVALAVVAAPFLGPRLRWVAFGLAAVVGLARIYVGAHLPLDMIGGAGLGLAVGSAVRLAFGVEPARRGQRAQPSAA
jgi:membrane-associated phospholipid phosphatase